MFCIKKKKHCTLQACIREYEASYRRLLVSVIASQGQDKKSGRFPVLSCVSSFFSLSSPLQQMVKRKSLSAWGRMHQGQGLSSEVHSEPGWLGRTILHTLSLIKYMREKAAGFAKQLDTKILIRLGILQNSRLEPHRPVWQSRHKQEHAQTNSDRGILLATLRWREVEEM